MESIGSGDLTPEDRGLIRASLLEISSMAVRVIRSVAPSEVIAGTSAYEQALAVMELYGDHQMFTRVHNSVHLTILTAAEHMKTFVAVVAREGTTTPTATLTRGAVEALSKGNYLLTAPNSVAVLQRYVGLQEYEFQAMRTSEFQDSEGNPIETADYIKQLRADLTDHGIRPLSLKADHVNLYSMVRALLDSSAELDAGLSGKLYAELSSIAHANTSAIAMHLLDDGDGPRLRLPRSIVLEQAGMNVGTLIDVIDKYLEFHRPPAPVRERWEAVLVRADPAVRRLQQTLDDQS